MGEQMALSIILSVHYIRKRFRISTPISQSLFSISHTINSNMGCAITMGSIEPLVNLVQTRQIRPRASFATGGLAPARSMDLVRIL